MSKVRLAGLVAVAIASVVVTFPSISIPFGYDSGAWPLIARWWIQYDIAPYRDAVETKGPTLYLALRLLLEWVSVAPAAVRIAMIVLYAGAAVLFTQLAARVAPFVVAALTAVLWVWLSTHRVWALHGFYTDELVAMGGLAGVSLAFAHPWLAGISLGLAAGVKPIVVGPALAAFILARHRRWRVVAGAVLTTVMLVGVMALCIGLSPVIDLYAGIIFYHGDLDRVGWAPRWNLCFAHGTEYLAHFPWLLPAAGAGLLTGLLDARTRRVTVAATLWLALDGLMLLAQLRCAQHQWIPMLVPTMLLCCVPFGVAWQWDRVPQWHPLGPRVNHVAVCLAVAALLWLAWPTAVVRWQATRIQWHRLSVGDWPTSPYEPYIAEVGDYIREHTTPAQRIHVHGDDHPWTFGVYWHAQRRPAVRVYYDGSITRVFDMQQQADQLATVLPTYIVQITHDPASLLTPIKQAHYELERTFHGGGLRIECWRLRQETTG